MEVLSLPGHSALGLGWWQTSHGGNTQAVSLARKDQGDLHTVQLLSPQAYFSPRSQNLRGEETLLFFPSSSTRTSFLHLSPTGNLPSTKLVACVGMLPCVPGQFISPLCRGRGNTSWRE
jgi:hypothetical protein